MGKILRTPSLGRNLLVLKKKECIFVDFVLTFRLHSRFAKYFELNKADIILVFLPTNPY